ncbi:hypothetical protein [Olleya namhaensis]|uniref:hypothetical protein n=1 Tax=Olleya namhaensis TaxID=1144750 RepID=UPI00232D5737|nr:hypothetical protein [Olleya namhaensis]
MRIEHLEERVLDYKKSIEIVVEKKTLWKTTTKDLLVNTLTTIVNQYSIGWNMQQLNWINNNEAVNITFESFPSELINCTNKIPTYQFIPGAALVFSQSYNGDVFVFILFPIVENMPIENSTIDLGILSPKEITEKIIIEKVDEFLKEMIKWEVPAIKNKLGY